jgi:transposase-like protein
MPMSYARVRPYVRHEILERVGAGERLKAICAEPGMPCPESVTGWARADPAFAAAYAAAKARGAHLRVWLYDEAKAKAVVARLAAGETIAQALKHPGMPNPRVFRYWRRAQAELHAEVARLTEVKRQAQAWRARQKWRDYDPKVGDRILVRVGRGAPLRKVLAADKGLPCLAVVRRWRRANRAFADDLKVAMTFARYRRGARRLWSEALQEAIFCRIAEGASFRDLARQPDMPCLGTLSAWMKTKPGFAEAVLRACELREQALLDDQLDVARALTPATMAEGRKRIAAIGWRIARLRRRPKAPWGGDDLGREA